MAGAHTLAETERQVGERLSHMALDFQSMAVISGLFRAASAVRNHLERTVLSKHDLSWTAFLVLWVTWIWERLETRQIAAECGLSKATLTGVLITLEGRGLVTREKDLTDGRLVIVQMTSKGIKTMDGLFPEFNRHERQLTSQIDASQQVNFTEMLKLLGKAAESTN